MFAGFSVGGADWPKPELIGVTDLLLLRRLQRRVAFEEAAITHQLGGKHYQGLHLRSGAHLRRCCRQRH